MDPTTPAPIDPAAVADRILTDVFVNFPHTDKCGLHKLAFSTAPAHGKKFPDRCHVYCVTCAGAAPLPTRLDFERAWNRRLDVETTGPTLDAGTHQPV